jgi:hypothetical protein
LPTAPTRSTGGARWFATNLDLTIPTADGKAPGNGTLVQAIRAAVEVDPVVAGKPEPPLLETSIERLSAKEPLMIGDRLDSDIAGAHAVGIASLWVATGVNDAHDLVLAPPAQRPTYIAAGLGALAEPQPGVQVDGRRHTCAGWTAEVVDDAVTMSGDGEPYDGLRGDPLRRLAGAGRAATGGVCRGGEQRRAGVRRLRCRQPPARGRGSSAEGRPRKTLSARYRGSNEARRQSW